MSITDEAARAAAEEYWNGKGDHISVWLDCDSGHDDAFALLLASKIPKVHLLGVSTVHGNASLANTTRNTLSILEALGEREIAVFPGAVKPFCRDAVHAEAIHGDTGLDGTTILPEPVRTVPQMTGDDSALKAMYNAICNTPPGTTWVVSTGALTNIGLLFAVYPSLIKHIAGLSIMGGVVGNGFTDAPLGRLQDRPDEQAKLEESQGLNKNISKEQSTYHGWEMGDNVTKQGFGNTTPFAEFNIYCDPEAAASIFSQPSLAAKTTLISLDITHQVLATNDVTRMLHYGHSAQPASENKDEKPSGVRHLFHEILTYFTSTYAREFGMTTGPPLHDPLAVLAACCPTSFDDKDGERFGVYIVKEGDSNPESGERDASKAGQCGRTMMKLLSKGEQGVRIPRACQADKFWHLVDLSLREAEKDSPVMVG
ncbi:nucleoside hydrolase [Tothia fuscella]|uniref:Nucleoside hydrolase n=1 Tax=Tothia fuscella TaxID=1048955 RepID=A0A9P4TW24_9PEZI|nr:nucleoside hydrolase [Tothia fuscella]